MKANNLEWLIMLHLIKMKMKLNTCQKLIIIINNTSPNKHEDETKYQTNDY